MKGAYRCNEIKILKCFCWLLIVATKKALTSSQVTITCVWCEFLFFIFILIPSFGCEWVELKWRRTSERKVKRWNQFSSCTLNTWSIVDDWLDIDCVEVVRYFKYGPVMIVLKQNWRLNLFFSVINYLDYIYVGRNFLFFKISF